jgi:hypothetical protein
MGLSMSLAFSSSCEPSRVEYKNGHPVPVLRDLVAVVRGLVGELFPAKTCCERDPFSCYIVVLVYSFSCYCASAEMRRSCGS